MGEVEVFEAVFDGGGRSDILDNHIDSNVENGYQWMYILLYF